MCNRYRTKRGEVRAGESIELEAWSDLRIPVRLGKWAGSATHEKLKWWLRHPGNELLQTVDVVTEISEVAQDDGELIWGPAPPDCRLLFVLEASPLGKAYRLAKLVTTAATDAQRAYYRHERFPLTGGLIGEKDIEVIAPADLSPPQPKPQGELF